MNPIALRIGLITLTALMCLSAASAAQRPDNKEAQAIATASNAFAADIYGKIADGQGNVFFSPYSIHDALTMTFAGARGQTAEQMAKALRVPNDTAKVNKAYGQFLAQLGRSAKMGDQALYQLVVANALWLQKGYPFNNEYQQTVKADYQAALEQLDFAATEQARATINAWVEKQTQNKIKDLIQPGFLDNTTRLVLTNAIYFKSNWDEPFNKVATEDGPFHVDAAKTVKVPMMHSARHFGYAETSAYQAVEMPYVGRQLSMLIVVPRKVDGLAEIEKTLTPETLAVWTKAPQSRKVDLFLPRFKTTAQLDLAKALVGMGMTDAFAQARADFSGMASVERLFISAVVHKAYVDVNEEGTEAAAATAVGIKPSAMPVEEEPVVVKADRPFIFLIRHQSTGAILFMGRLANPNP